MKSIFYLENNNFKLICFFVLFFLFQLGCSETTTNKELSNTFSYNIPYSPQSFDPLLQRGINARYLLNHLHITLFQWNDKDQLVLSGADKCDWILTEFICQLKKNIYFNNKLEQSSDLESKNTSLKLVKAKHYINSLNLLKEDLKSEYLDFKNISFYAKDDFTLVFKMKEKSNSFKNKLAQIEISPRPEKKYYNNTTDYYSSGNYKISEFIKNQFITLKHTKNDIYVKVYFIDDQTTALRLFETKKLDLLTQLPVREFKKYLNSKQIFHVNMSRMDGMFFNSEIDENLKKALFHSLNFKKLQKLYYSIGLPGCPALPQKLYNRKHCYTFDLTKAKKFLEKSNIKSLSKTLRLNYSNLGGDDIQRGMEWMAHEWETHLGIKILIEPLESGVFLQKIKTKKFEIIRKGIPLDSPTCMDGLDSFWTLSPNNVSGFKNKKFELTLVNLESNPENKDLCDEALNILHETYAYLPLGNMYFSFLQNNKFKGWYINSLNILDIEDLDYNLDYKEVY